MFAPEPGHFATRQIELVQTFADQAVIAIENVRLFDEVQARTRDLTEALQQQTATADVLKVISRSAFDLKAVLAVLVQSVLDLCDATGGNIHLRDGETFRLGDAIGLARGFCAIHARSSGDPGYRLGVRTRYSHRGHRAHSRCPRRPRLRAVGRSEDSRLPRPARRSAPAPNRGDRRFFGGTTGRRAASRDGKSNSSQTFADQAVIAIENVRLFDEVQARTRDLTEALQQQTATADVLKVISRSAFDLDAVLETLISTAVRTVQRDQWRNLPSATATCTATRQPDRRRPRLSRISNRTSAISAGRGTLIGRVAVGDRHGRAIADCLRATRNTR